MNENGYQQYLVAALSKDKYQDQNILNTGLIALSDVLKSIGDEFSRYITIYMPLLEGILNEGEVKKEVKLNVINLLGQICLRTNKAFIPYLDNNMKLIFSACQLSLSSADDDPDFDDYLQNLRLTLSSTLNLIFYTLDSCGETVKFEQYIEPSIRYFSSLIVNDSIMLKPDILKLITDFIVDVVNSIGGNIKKILEFSIVKKLSERIQETKIDKLISHLKDNEETLSIAFK